MPLPDSGQNGGSNQATDVAKASGMTIGGPQTLEYRDIEVVSVGLGVLSVRIEGLRLASIVLENGRL